MLIADSFIADLWRDARDSLGALERPRRVPVSVGAAESLVLDDAGGYTGPWDSDTVPYLIEPMDMLASRYHSAVVFCGPARAGKTAGLILGWMAHAVTNDIGRMMVMHMTEQKASMFVKLDVDPAIEASDKLRALRSPRAHDNTIGLKVFRHGMAVRFGHPSASEMAGTTYRYVALTDYDRFTQKKGMGGSIFDSAAKRTQTAMSRGMVLAESSPERQLTDASWTPATPHEAPPVGGILGLYNRGDRRRFYWPCPHCGEFFEAAPGLSLFASLPPEVEILDQIRTLDIRAFASKHAHIVCPHCAAIIGHEDKHTMNIAGRWVPDGQTIGKDGAIEGPEPTASVASYWLGGVAAAYQTWQSLLENYLQGLREYALTGEETTLEAKTYVDQAMPYLPRALRMDKEASIEDRLEPIPRFIVPHTARFIVATADVQGGTRGRFVCEVRAFGRNMESWLIDRFSIATTERHGEAAQVDPAGYPEDWDLLTDKLVRATYRTDNGREMRVLRVAVDTGGEEGVTPNAYAWFRRLRAAGLSSRVLLVKGGSTNRDKPVTKGSARDNRGKAMRDLPIWLLNTDYFKDIVAASMRRTAPGPGYAHVGDWIRTACPGYFDELRAEVRQANGKWKKVRARNESLDLWGYSLAVVESLGFGPKGRLSWDDPPAWAMPQDDGNSEVIDAEERRAERAAITNPIQHTPRAAPPQKPVAHNDDALFSPIALTR